MRYYLFYIAEFNLLIFCFRLLVCHRLASSFLGFCVMSQGSILFPEYMSDCYIFLKCVEEFTGKVIWACNFLCERF